MASSQDRTSFSSSLDTKSNKPKEHKHLIRSGNFPTNAESSHTPDSSLPPRSEDLPGKEKSWHATGEVR